MKWPMPWQRRGDLDEAIAVHRDSTQLRPHNATILGCLGRLYQAKGLSAEASNALAAAEVAEREAERQRPTVVASAHANRVFRGWRIRASTRRSSPSSHR